MNEDLKKCLEDAIYKLIMENIKNGKLRANLRIEVSTDIDIRGLKGRLIGEILIGEESMPRIETSKEASLQDIDKILKSLGI
ncbi:MAG: hypothetical protein NZ922_03265 [Candidatus Methanomethyliaceae archaeon]|nr:hypothetical protein [Candidatus Methanomethyliaceae archaeon]MCX8170181.1 hypothetical protein [Candidatus Methanomethyliaceae archaeon]MDW7970544.1 hypothetical protein [Nitrososphaerota archaeon]